MAATLDITALTDGQVKFKDTGNGDIRYFQNSAFTVQVTDTDVLEIVRLTDQAVVYQFDFSNVNTPLVVDKETLADGLNSDPYFFRVGGSGGGSPTCVNPGTQGSQTLYWNGLCWSPTTAHLHSSTAVVNGITSANQPNKVFGNENYIATGAISKVEGVGNTVDTAWTANTAAQIAAYAAEILLPTTINSVENSALSVIKAGIFNSIRNSLSCIIGEDGVEGGGNMHNGADNSRTSYIRSSIDCSIDSSQDTEIVASSFSSIRDSDTSSINSGIRCEIQGTSHASILASIAASITNTGWVAGSHIINNTEAASIDTCYSTEVSCSLIGTGADRANKLIGCSGFNFTLDSKTNNVVIGRAAETEQARIDEMVWVGSLNIKYAEYSRYTTVDVDYTTLPQDRIIYANPVDNVTPITITLDNPVLDGQIITIKAGANTTALSDVILSAAITLIDGAGSLSISVAYRAVKIQYANSTWNILSDV